MEQADIAEIDGRIEAVGRMTLELAALLEDTHIIDGPSLSARLRDSVVPCDRSPAHLHIARRVLGEMANALDSARAWRQAEADRPGIRRH